MAAGVAVVVLLAGNLPWQVLGALNLRAGIAVPWALLPMALYLWGPNGRSEKSHRHS